MLHRELFAAHAVMNPSATHRRRTIGKARSFAATPPACAWATWQSYARSKSTTTATWSPSTKARPHAQDLHAYWSRRCDGRYSDDPEGI